MNLIEAIKSGKRFKRKGDTSWYCLPNHKHHDDLSTALRKLNEARR
jgi:hypothetical protein